MCRSIKTLRVLDPPATDEEIEAAALQYVRKLSGYREPSARNAEAFATAVEEVTAATRKLLAALPPGSTTREEAARAAAARAEDRLARR